MSRALAQHGNRAAPGRGSVIVVRRRQRRAQRLEGQQHAAVPAAMPRTGAKSAKSCHGAGRVGRRRRRAASRAALSRRSPSAGADPAARGTGDHRRRGLAQRAAAHALRRAPAMRPSREPDIDRDAVAAERIVERGAWRRRSSSDPARVRRLRARHDRVLIERRRGHAQHAAPPRRGRRAAHRRRRRRCRARGWRASCRRRRSGPSAAARSDGRRARATPRRSSICADVVRMRAVEREGDHRPRAPAARPGRPPARRVPAQPVEQRAASGASRAAAIAGQSSRGEPFGRGAEPDRLRDRRRARPRIGAAASA